MKNKRYKVYKASVTQILDVVFPTPSMRYAKLELKRKGIQMHKKFNGGKETLYERAYYFANGACIVIRGKPDKVDYEASTVIELKTTSYDVYPKILKKRAIVQLQLYMFLTNCEHGLLIVKKQKTGNTILKLKIDYYENVVREVLAYYVLLIEGNLVDVPEPKKEKTKTSKSCESLVAYF